MILHFSRQGGKLSRDRKVGDVFGGLSQHEVWEFCGIHMHYIDGEVEMKGALRFWQGQWNFEERETNKLFLFYGGLE